MSEYNIYRVFADEELGKTLIEQGVTLEEARAHCKDPETSSKTARSDDARERTRKYGPWFDCYEEA
jgi:hypothetical protein